MHIIQSIFTRITAYFYSAPKDEKYEITHSLDRYLTPLQKITVRTKLTPLMILADKHAFWITRTANKTKNFLQKFPTMENLTSRQVSEPSLFCRKSSQPIDDEELIRKTQFATGDADFAAALQDSLKMQDESQLILSDREINQQISDDEQLARALAVELNHAEKPKPYQPAKEEDSANLPSEKSRENNWDMTDDWQLAIISGNEKMYASYAEKKLTVISNNGKGNQCLLISLIQHATGDYTQQHESLVDQYRSVLMFNNPNIRRSDSLNRDTADFFCLLAVVNHDFNTDISIEFQSALNSEGTVHSHAVGKGSQKKIIFDQGGHYEAVTALNVQ